MPETLIKVDLTKSPYENDMIHNRWHPDIPMVAWVKPGDDFIIETYDWTGGFIKNNDSRRRRARHRSVHRALPVRPDRRRRAPSPATCWWSTCSTSARCRRACGASTASSPRRTAAAS